MKQIPLTKGYFALVDDEDYEDLIQFKWHLTTHKNKTCHYARRFFMQDGKQRQELMHKRITGFKQTDHINGNGLDNQRKNLRECSDTQNRANTLKQKGTYSSQYKGVSWHKGDNKWQARVQVNRKEYALGSFTNEIDAAKAYDTAALKYFGEFAMINFPEASNIGPVT